LAHGLAASGHRVRGFVRDPERWVDRPEGAEAAVGDVTHPASLFRAAAGCDAILHAAALVRIWVRDARQFDRVNVEGLGNVIEAAREHASRLVYVSSFIALGPTDGTIHDEDTPRSGTDFHNHYERTKWIADQMARRIEDVPLVRVYPGVVFGPGTLTQGNHVVQLLLEHARGRLPGLLGSGRLRQCFAFVDDVVLGTVAALERGAPGAGYILGGENRTAVELFQAFHAASGIAPPRRRVPFAVAALIGKLQRWRALLLGIEPRLTDEVVGIYRHEWAYDSAQARRELGYVVTPFGDAVQRTVDWLRATGGLGG